MNLEKRNPEELNRKKLNQEKIYLEIKSVIQQNLVFYLAGILILLGMKSFYTGAECRQLKWLLAPTAEWVGILSGIPFSYEPGAGYVNHGLRIVIAPSCSGFRFLTITFSMLFFSFLPQIGLSEGKEGILSGKELSENLKRNLKKGGWLISSLLLSYLLTIFVNGLRIIGALYLPLFLRRADVSPGFLTPDRLHTLIGIAVYFTALLVIYRLAACFFGKKEQSAKRTLSKCLPPLFWYFFFTLGIPFLSRAYEREGAAFTEYALLIVSCCGLLLLPHLLTFTVNRFSKN